MIRLRTVQERTLQQVMIDAVGSEAAYVELITKSHGNRCLIILEGLDEISAHWQQNDEMFSKLVNSTTFLSFANIIITSRPHACVHLCKDKKFIRTVEIVGLDKTKIKEYAEMYFDSKRDSNTVEKSRLNTAEKFMEQVHSDPHISSLCYVPVCLDMVLECFMFNDKILHSTFTELYQSFVVSRINYHICSKKAGLLGTIQISDKDCFKNLDTVLSDVPEVLEETFETIFLLSKLAYKSYFEWYECKSEPDKVNVVTTDVAKEILQTGKHHAKSYIEDRPILRRNQKNPKIVYVKKDLAHCNITNSGNDACGLLKATNTLYGAGNTTVYSFNHLSVQEYFCALYISLLPEDQQLQLVKDYSTEYPHIWPFYAGITKLKSPDVSHYLHKFLLQDNQLEKPLHTDCKNVVKNYNISDYQTVTVLNSIYEAQLSSDVYKETLFSLFMDDFRLLSRDCMCISYFVSVASITQLYLQRCNIGDQEAEMLGKCNMSSLKVLDFNANFITYEGMTHLIPIVNTLTHLSAALNFLSDDSISLLLNPSLHFNHLIQLDIRSIHMTALGATALGECFKVNNSLQSLEVCNNNICDHGLMGLLFINLHRILIRLTVKNCNLTSNCGLPVTYLLHINNPLNYLEISGNNIGDEGITIISHILCNNTTLVQLLAHSCGFHSKGAESVAEMLQVNKTLKYLNISKNDIKDDGMAAVIHSIEVNTTLLQLKLYECCYGCKGLKSIDKMLKVNKSLQELCISVKTGKRGDIDKETSAVLNTFLKNDCKLKKLNIIAIALNIVQHVEEANFENSSTTLANATYCTMDINCIRPFADGLYLQFELKV